MKRYAPLVVGVAVALVCARLSLWQFRRFGEKRAAAVAMDERLGAPPVELPLGRSAGPVAGDSLAFRRAVAVGEFDFEHQLIVVARSLGGVPGVHIATPLVMRDGSVILVERGWMGSPDARSVEIEKLIEPVDARVVGVLLEPSADARAAADAGWPRRVRALHPKDARATRTRERFPLFLRRTSLPQGAPPGMRPVPLPTVSSGRHLSYAIQWLAFAVIALVGSAMLYRSTGGKREAGSGKRRH